VSDYHFVSAIRERGSFPASFSIDEIKNEPMFFNCDLNFVKKNCGVITHYFLLGLPDDWKHCNPVIDSRVHMLMPGWFGAIPGFHHDDVPRTTPSGQPNYDTPEYRSEHLTGLVNAEIAPTLFALGEHRLPVIKDGVIYRAWHPIVEEQLQTGVLKPYEVKSGSYVEFDWQSIHTATKAVGGGWRWFIRLSRNTDRQKTITNEIRCQVQVYLEAPMDGW
jgi:hypothetical protein